MFMGYHVLFQSMCALCCFVFLHQHNIVFPFFILLVSYIQLSRWILVFFFFVNLVQDAFRKPFCSELNILKQYDYDQLTFI